MNKITFEERADVYMDALEEYGANAQCLVAIEEMSELTKEIIKNFRGAKNVERIAEEIADVTIMLEQLRMIFMINDEVCEKMGEKIRMLKRRIRYTREEKE